jgi:two-component system KDP operon response regulator KdpE
MKIVIVDDEPQIRKLVRAGLEGYGYEVLTASNGQEAINAVAQKAPDVIILDIALGTEPDGLEVCSTLREWSKVPIIMLSVRNDEKRCCVELPATQQSLRSPRFARAICGLTL